MNIKIQQEKILLVEGKDEVAVFEELLGVIGRQDIQIIPSGGKIQFKSLFPSIVKSPGFGDVSSYAVIHDSDSDPAAALQRIQSVLDRCQQPVPTRVNEFVERHGTRVGVYLLPGDGAPGMLEDLYLATLAGQSVLGCIDKCIAELSAVCPPPTARGQFAVPTNVAKARTLGTFMATSDPLNCLGLAAKAGYWDLSHGAMSTLTHFIKSI